MSIHYQKSALYNLGISNKAKAGASLLDSEDVLYPHPK